MAMVSTLNVFVFTKRYISAGKCLNTSTQLVTARVHKAISATALTSDFKYTYTTLLSYKNACIKLSKMISTDQEPIQSDPISCPQNQKGNFIFTFYA